MGVLRRGICECLHSKFLYLDTCKIQIMSKSMRFDLSKVLKSHDTVQTKVGRLKSAAGDILVDTTKTEWLDAGGGTKFQIL